jgi:hypothetical protein
LWRETFHGDDKGLSNQHLVVAIGSIKKTPLLSCSGAIYGVSEINLMWSLAVLSILLFTTYLTKFL